MCLCVCVEKPVRPVRFNRLACVALLINQTDLFTIYCYFLVNADGRRRNKIANQIKIPAVSETGVQELR